MSIEEQVAEVVRTVFREEMAALSDTEDIDLLTVDQVAQLLKFSDRRSVYKLRREGKLKGVNLGDKTLRFRRSDIRRFIEECESQKINC